MDLEGGKCSSLVRITLPSANDQMRPCYSPSHFPHLVSFPSFLGKSSVVFVFLPLLISRASVSLLRFCHRDGSWRDEVANGAERCMCMPQLSNELIIEAQIDERFVYSSPFFHTGMPALFHHRNGFKSQLLFRTKLQF